MVCFSHRKKPNKINRGSHRSARTPCHLGSLNVLSHLINNGEFSNFLKCVQLITFHRLYITSC